MIPLSMLGVTLLLSAPLDPAAPLHAVATVRQGAPRSITLRDASGHTANITTVAYSADGKFLITGSTDGVVVRWDTATGKPVRTFLAADWPQSSGFNVTPDGSLVLVGGLIDAPKLLETATGEELPLPLNPLPHAPYPVLPPSFHHHVLLSPDGATVAMLDAWLLRLFDRKTGAEVGYIAPPNGSGGFAAPAFSPDGRLIAVGAGRQLLLVDTATHEIKRSLRDAPDNITITAFAPNGEFIAAGGKDGDVALWRVTTGVQLRTIAAHKLRDAATKSAAETNGIAPGTKLQPGTPTPGKTGRIAYNFPPEIVSLAFSPDGKQLVTSCLDGLLAVWDTDTGVQLHAEPTLAGISRKISLSPDGQTLAIGGEHDPKLWDMRTWQSRYLQPQRSPAAETAAFAPDGKTFVVGMANGAAEVWETQSGRLARNIEAHAARVRYTAFAADGKQLIIADDKQMRFWNVASGREAMSARPLPQLGYAAAFSRDGRLVATPGATGDAEVWDTLTAQRVQILKQDSKPFTLAFAADGARLAASDSQGDVTLWNTVSGEEAHMIVNKDWRIRTPISFTGDGSRMAEARGRITAAGSETIIQIWNTQTGDEITWLRDHHQFGDLIAFSPDGRWLAMNTTPQHAIVLFDVASRKSVELKGHVGYVTTLTFSPDSKALLSADQGGGIKLWSLR